MMRPVKIIIGAVWTYFCLFKILPYIVFTAYDTRLHAIREYGPIIHEFDPYFNLRATEYLYNNGWQRFVTWFDYKSWYPLGRPVGTTIFPGMQVTAVFLKNHIMTKMSLNDVCAYIPAWFGASASVFTGLIAYETSLPVATTDAEGQPYGSILENIPLVSFLYSKLVTPILAVALKGLTMVFGSDLGLATTSILPGVYNQRKVVDLSSPAVEAGLIAAAIMAIVPAHMMRSVGGGYDNESIANTSMTMTFYFWVRSLRGGVGYESWRTCVWALIAAFAYFYMVAVWGGYVFVINLIGIHAGVLVLLGRFGTKLYRAYSVFYLIGTALAIQVPVVGWTPLKSLEQLGPAAVFFGFQLLGFCEYQKKKNKLNRVQTWKLRVAVFALAGVVAGIAIFILDQKFGYFGPISSRVRGLFVKHTKTGNPLVDSVAEHQPASPDSYKNYLGQQIVYIVPYGFGLVALRYFHDASSFLIVYGVATYFFSHKMVRLILLTAPIASVFVGITLGRVLSFFMYNVLGFTPSFFDILLVDEKLEAVGAEKKSPKSKKSNNGKKVKKTKDEKSGMSSFAIGRSLVCKAVAAYGAYYVFTQKVMPPAKVFKETSIQISKQLSNPTIVMKGTLKSGKEVLVDDYRECYWWIRDNTPKDARIMAWWDYGYQISAIANRTTIADGNTWNHEHIALLGRALTSSEREGHRIARHLADYVLVWAGGGGDDIAKSPHLRRIANSVYRDLCPGDPVCSDFGQTRTGPSRMMAESMLYKLVGHQVRTGVMADPNRFRHKFTSKYQKCRVFKVQSVSQESKAWVADPKNRVCDAPGSWFCRGQYPPGMEKILAEKRDFSQLEDFNKDEDDSEYQQKYFENLSKRKNPSANQANPSPTPSSGPKRQPWKPARTVSDAAIQQLNNKWEDSEETSMLWELISQNKVREFMEVVGNTPELAHLRSSDGRGPMFWAMEKRSEKIVRVLKKLGVKDTYLDAQGLSPIRLASINNHNEL